MKNNKGLTLVEILATLVILGIVMLLLFSLINNTNAEGNKQTKENRELQTISYALKIITKDVRQSTGTIPVNPYEFTLINAFGSSNNLTYKYDVDTKTLSRNSSPIAINVDYFEAIYSPNSLNIQIINSQNEEVATTLYYRKE